MKALAITLCVSLLLSSTAYAAGHKLSEWNQKECVELILKGSDKKGAVVVAVAPLVAAGLNVAVKQAAVLIKKKIKKEALKYTASYGASLAGSNFFRVQEDQITKDLARIEITRYASHKSVSPQASSRPASFISLALHKAPNGAFSFTVDQANVWYAKCKINHKENSEKDPPFPTIDLKVTVTINCFWQDWQGVPRSSVLGTLTIPVNKVPVKGESNAPPAKEPESLDRPCASGKDRIVSWFPPFPINYYAAGSRNDVAYLLNVTVNEFDDYQKMAEKYGEVMGGVVDMNQAMILNLIEQLTTSDD